MLRGHVAKGDPVDVANFSMMLHQRGERISGRDAASPSAAQAQPVVNQKMTTEREAFEVWVRKELGDPIRLTMRERNLGAQAWAAATRAALAQQEKMNG
jgi:hypothetical protein